jgi:LysM repeat protein
MRAASVLAAALVAAGFGFAGKAGGAPPPARYVVVPGDSLSSIAERFGVSLGRLSRANRLDLEAPLLIGTVLRLPQLTPESSEGKGWSSSYLVEPGDSLGAIAGRYGVTPAALARANGLRLAGVLLVGTKLRVPAPPSQAQSPSPGFAGVRITVQPGQTLSGIAARYGVSLTSLSTFNGIDPNGLLLVGQRLEIPPTTEASSSLAEVALSQASPYPAGSTGVDISYPDCAALELPTADFTIVGLNDGRPFTTNPCFAAEYSAARASNTLPSIYLNSAYAPSLFRHVTSDCLLAARNHEASPALQRAYAIGCSEGEAAQAELAGIEAAALWIDVEPANTWSKRPLLNRATINGFVDYLLTQGSRPVVGAYSADVYWQKLTGGWSSFALPEWIATGGGRDCSSRFASGPVWLSQNTTSHDYNATC